MAKMEFKVGDKVKFKDDLVVGKIYGNSHKKYEYLSGMFKDEIYEVVETEEYDLTIKNGFSWYVTPEMIELVERYKKNTKFKIGDIVAIKNRNDGAKYKVIGGPVRNAFGNAYRLTCISEYKTIGTSKSDSKSPFYCLWVSGKDLELDKEEVPTITQHLIRGYKTIVKLSNGKVGIAQCSPEDKFDVYEGLRVATARAYGRDIEEPKKEEPKKEETKLEIWDRVRYKGIEGNFGEGMIVEIEAVSPLPYLVLFDKPNEVLHDSFFCSKNKYPSRCWWCKAEQLEKI